MIFFINISQLIVFSGNTLLHNFKLLMFIRWFFPYFVNFKSREYIVIAADTDRSINITKINKKYLIKWDIEKNNKKPFWPSLYRENWQRKFFGLLNTLLKVRDFIPFLINKNQSNIKHNKYRKYLQVNADFVLLLQE